MAHGFWSDYRATYRGPYGWTMAYASAWGVILVAALVWLVIGLFEAQSTRGQILHATGTICVVIWLALIKLWSWVQILRVRLERHGDG